MSNAEDNALKDIYSDEMIVVDSKAYRVKIIVDKSVDNVLSLVDGDGKSGRLTITQDYNRRCCCSEFLSEVFRAYWILNNVPPRQETLKLDEAAKDSFLADYVNRFLWIIKPGVDKAFGSFPTLVVKAVFDALRKLYMLNVGITLEQLARIKENADKAIYAECPVTPNNAEKWEEVVTLAQVLALKYEDMKSLYNDVVTK